VERVATVTITHLHVDHFGGAARLARASGAPVVAHPAEIEAILTDARSLAEVHPLEDWGVPPERRAAAGGPSRPPLGDVHDLRFIAAGELLPVPGRTLVPLHTPGHTTGHLCIDAPEDGMIFTGDHVLPVTRPGFALGAAPAGNGLVDYLESLRLTGALDRRAVHPAHEYSFTGLAERCTQLERHHLTRADEVAAVLAVDPGATIWEVASQVRWTVGWQNLDGYHLRLALLQTACHVDRLRRLGAVESA
jgi:glyoxylase-like metal-dependent hydrolase (beta-lactamase superfamily II)